MVIHYFSDALVEARKKKGLSKSQVAESFGWMGMHYGRFEKGHIFPTKANIDKFASLMDMTVSEVENLIEMEKQSRLDDLDQRVKKTK